MYRIGDTVMIRKDLMAGENYGFYLSTAMSKYKGREAKIVGVRDFPPYEEIYYLDVDGSNFLWSSEMLEPKVDNNFEKAKSKHEELLKEREEENRKMELEQIEENLKGITELVNKLYEDVE